MIRPVRQLQKALHYRDRVGLSAVLALKEEPILEPLRRFAFHIGYDARTAANGKLLGAEADVVDEDAAIQGRTFGEDADFVGRFGIVSFGAHHQVFKRYREVVPLTV